MGVMQPWCSAMLPWRCRSTAQHEHIWPPGKYVEEGGDAKADKVRPLLKLMQFIGQLSGGRSVSQVALSYLMAKGAPCFGPAVSWEMRSNRLAGG